MKTRKTSVTQLRAGLTVLRGSRTFRVARKTTNENGQVLVWYENTTWGGASLKPVYFEKSDTVQVVPSK